MRVLALIFSTLLLMGTQARQDMRIVSTSLCADSYVLAAAPPAQITALSWQANDAVSGAPPALAALPKAWDDPERLLTLKPSLVVFGPGEGTISKAFLNKAGIPSVSLIWAEDFAGVEMNRALIKAALGQDFKPAPLPVSAPTDISILYLSRAGGTAGPGTFVDAAIRAAGGRNIITTQGWHTPQLETLLSLHPDLIITSFFDSGYDSLNENGMRHFALQNKLKNTPSLSIPGKLWPCAGPGLYQAEAMIKNKISELSDE